MKQKDEYKIQININIFIGDISGSAVIQGGDGNTMSVSSSCIHPDIREILRQFCQMDLK